MNNTFKFQVGDLLHFPSNRNFGAALVTDKVYCESGLPFYALHFQKDGSFIELSTYFVESRGVLL